MAGAKAQFELIADDSQAQARIEAMFAKMVGGAGNAGRAVKETSGFMDQLGNKMQTAIIGGVGYMAAFTKATELAMAAVRSLREENEKAADAFGGNAEPLSKLVQLAGGSPQAMQRMVAESKKTAVETGVGMAKSVDLQATLENLGMQKEREWIAPLAPSFDIAKLVGGAKNLQSSMGKAETGDVRGIVNKLIRVGGKSQVEADVFGSQVAEIGQAGSALGASDEETMAALALSIPIQGGNIAETSTALKAFARETSEKGIKGQGWRGRLQEAQKKTGGDISKAQKLFGERAFLGYQFLSKIKPEEFEALTNDASQAQAQSVSEDDVSGISRVRASIPELAETDALKIAEEEEKQALSNLKGAPETQRKSVRKRLATSRLNRGAGAFEKMGALAGEKIGLIGEDIMEIPGLKPGAIVSVASKAGGAFSKQQAQTAINSTPGGIAISSFISATKAIVDALSANTMATKANTGGANGTALAVQN